MGLQFKLRLFLVKHLIEEYAQVPGSSCIPSIDETRTIFKLRESREVAL